MVEIREIKKDINSIILYLKANNISEVVLKPTNEAFVDSNPWAELIKELMNNKIKIKEFVPVRLLHATLDMNFSNAMVNFAYIPCDWGILK